jgi:hypothetical protein
MLNTGGSPRYRGDALKHLSHRAGSDGRWFRYLHGLRLVVQTVHAYITIVSGIYCFLIDICTIHTGNIDGTSQL